MIPADALDDLSAAVAGLFLPGVHTAVTTVGGATSHHPLEVTAVMGAGPVRRDEFLAGRACARHALAELGEYDEPIGVGAAREPLWPAGIVGSITHTRLVAAAAVARSRDAWGVGLDAESLDAVLEPGQRGLLFTPVELVRLSSDETLEPAAGLVLFSAKESVYKCVFPRTGWRLSFHDVDVRLDLQQHRFAARVTAPSVRPTELEPLFLEGAFAIVAGHVVTGIVF